jgi:hypothetical protein
MQPRTEVSDRFQESDVTRLKEAGRFEFGLNVHDGITQPGAIRIRRRQARITKSPLVEAQTKKPALGLKAVGEALLRESQKRAKNKNAASGSA